MLKFCFFSIFNSVFSCVLFVTQSLNIPVLFSTRRTKCKTCSAHVSHPELAPTQPWGKNVRNRTEFNDIQLFIPNFSGISEIYGDIMEMAPL